MDGRATQWEWDGPVWSLPPPFALSADFFLAVGRDLHCLGGPCAGKRGRELAARKVRHGLGRERRLVAERVKARVRDDELGELDPIARLARPTWPSPCEFRAAGTCPRSSSSSAASSPRTGPLRPFAPSSPPSIATTRSAMGEAKTTTSSAPSKGEAFACSNEAQASLECLAKGDKQACKKYFMAYSQCKGREIVRRREERRRNRTSLFGQ